jgi:hypothetical protein
MFFVKVFVLVFAILFAFQQNTQAQDVYNFYFQKQAPANAVLKAEEKTTPKPGDTAAPILETKVDPVAQTPPTVTADSTSKEKAGSVLSQEKSDSFRHWNVQFMRTLVADAYTDYYHRTDGRLAFQVGYRWNKFIGVETGTTIGMLDGQWSSHTFTDLWQSTIPYFGFRLNPVHLNIFGAEVLEVYVAAGGLIMNAAFPGLAGGRNGYGYYGGGVRINFGETVGLDLGVKTLANDTRYGFASAGIDLRF